MQGMSDMSGKVVAITGCTTGTGYVAAKAVASKGGEVIMLNRKSERATLAESRIKEEHPSAKISTIFCDLSEFDSVRDASKEIAAKYPNGIDVLCNNAGIMAMPDAAAKDGYDVQMTTNHLSHFLLTKEVMPLLEKAASRNGEARIVNMTSIARDGKPLKPDAHLGKNGGNLGGNGNWFTNAFFMSPAWERYHMTKLANFLFTYALHDRLSTKSSKIKSVVAHPGVASTNLQVTTASVGNIPLANTIVGMGMSAEDGTVSLLQCISDKDVKSGDFYGPPGLGFKGMSEKLDPTNKKDKKLLTDEQKALLWEESCKAVGEFQLV